VTAEAHSREPRSPLIEDPAAIADAHAGDAVWDAAVAVDFSASSTVGPRKQSPDRCWLAWGVRADGGVREPEYFRTRHMLAARLVDLLDRELGGMGVLCGFDFPLGYPAAADGAAVLPEGAALARLMGGLVEDAAGGTNNRFEVAGELNRRIRAQTGASSGPFWGHPAGRSYADLPFRKPAPTATRVEEFRPVERRLRAQGWAIQSPWKLAGAASVGGQAVLGLAMLDRVARALGGEAGFGLASASRVRLVEVWPSLCGRAVAAVDHPVKDARQVAACCAAMLA
jgi:precorrin-8X/cobalt-precorrin-8 methylmutase